MTRTNCRAGHAFEPVDEKFPQNGQFIPNPLPV
jgi:hypothetical protein